MFEDLYSYKARCSSVYDGDTITLDIDLGFGCWLIGQKCRLYGINTPELRGEDKTGGIAARNRLRQLVLNQDVYIQSIKDRRGKYGRLLVVVFLGSSNINQQLINEGFAQAYEV